MTGAQCPCCAGTGELDSQRRPVCPCAIQRRDTRSPDQLRRMAALQRIALRGVAYDLDGHLLPEHGEAFVDYRTGEVTR